LGRPGVFVPLFPDEAVWLGFAGADAKPVALKIRAGSQNAVTGGAWNEELHDQPQDYLVCPDQSSWDGVACGEGQIRQFTGTPLELLIYEPRPGVTVKRLQPGLPDFYYSLDLSSVSFVTQRLVSDPYGITSWSSEPTSRLSIYFVSPSSYHEMTGEDPLPIDSVYTPRLLP